MISSDQIVSAARAQAGSETLGDDSILEGLEVFLRAANAEAKLSERGVQQVRKMLIDTLANRLRVENYLAGHPALLQRPVEKPMFVFGLPRTGTTLAINLLNADPARRSLLRWEAFDSVPPPKASELSSGPRYEKAQALIEFSLKHAPHISAIHHENGDSPTECQFIMSQSFCTQVFEAQFDVPSYRDWFLRASYLPAFRYHKRFLQLLQSEAPGRWALKNPWHALFLDDLTAVYPDAQLVMTHRDPVDVVASACSLIKNVRVMFSDTVDCHRIGADMVDIFERMIARSNAYRAKHGQAAIYDLQYHRLMADPVGEMKQLYRRFDEPWTAAAEAAMTGYLDDNPKGLHGRHDYTLEEYGLTREGVRARFVDYCRAFEIPQRA